MKKLVIRMITIILLLGCAYATSPVQIKAFSSQNVARGAFGDDVIELTIETSVYWLLYWDD